MNRYNFNEWLNIKESEEQLTVFIKIIKRIQE